MHSFDRRLAALENSGASAACELICVELALDAQGRQRGEPVWAEWRDHRFERLLDEGAKDFRDRVRETVCSHLPPASARSVLFLEGSDREL